MAFVIAIRKITDISPKHKFGKNCIAIYFKWSTYLNRVTKYQTLVCSQRYNLIITKRFIFHIENVIFYIIFTAFKNVFFKTCFLIFHKFGRNWIKRFITNDFSDFTSEAKSSFQFIIVCNFKQNKVAPIFSINLK